MGAIACKIPVISVSSPMILEYAGEFVKIIDDGNYSTISHAIHSCLGETVSEFNSIGALQNRFSNTYMVKSFLALYEGMGN